MRWVPGSRNLFLVSHANGTIVVYDKEREDDANFKPTLPPDSAPTQHPSNPPSPAHPQTADETATDDDTTVTANPFSLHQLQRHLHIHPSSSPVSHSNLPSAPILPWNSLEEIWVTRPGSQWDEEKDREKEMTIAATKNPVSHWRVARQGIIGIDEF